MDASEFARYIPGAIPGDVRAYKGAGYGAGYGADVCDGFGSEW